MTPYELMATIAVVGLVVMGLVQLVVLHRSYGTVDRTNREASRWRDRAEETGLTAQQWRAQAQREARAAQELRQRYLPDPEREQRRAITPQPIPTAARPAVVRRPAPVPPIAQHTGETMQLPRVVDDPEPASRPVGTRTRARRTQEAES